MNRPDARIDTRATIEIALIKRATFSGRRVGELDRRERTSEVAREGGPERTDGCGPESVCGEMLLRGGARRSTSSRAWAEVLIRSALGSVELVVGLYMLALCPLVDFG